MQTFAIFGGTGFTGQEIVLYCLRQGYKVNLLYRDIATVRDDFKTNSNLTLIKGNSCNKEDVRRVLEGVDGVIVALGTRNSLEPTTEMSQSTKNIIEIMEELNISRVSVILSSFTYREADKVPNRFVPINNEHLKMRELLSKSSLEYVAVCPPHIADKPKAKIVITENTTATPIVSKYDLAEFMVNCILSNEYSRKNVSISNESVEPIPGMDI